MIFSLTIKFFYIRILLIIQLKGQAIKSSKSFTQKEVSLADTPLFFPQGFEKIFLAIYFIVLPYIAGLLFLFFYVAEGKTELFLSLNDDSSFILTWAIGYEIIATLAILYIVKSAISFSVKNKDKKPKFVRP
jgi:hypothetical protein